jgi:hypothetical protein
MAEKWLTAAENLGRRRQKKSTEKPRIAAAEKGACGVTRFIVATSARAV